ncbi:MAG: hypothetical protein ACREXY_17155, partial [Gammaproteobacteria bacterium]
PLAAAEVDMLAIDAGSRGPEDPELFDVVEEAMSIASLHRAYTFWRELDAKLSREELQVFIDASQQRATELSAGPLSNPLVT